MRKGQKRTHKCGTCGQLKEQVKDRMVQGGDMKWHCQPCVKAEADALWSKLTANLQMGVRR